MTTEYPKRRWFQFRLRTLLIAIMVLSLPLSWFAVRMERARRQKHLVQLVERLGGEVTYHWQYKDDWWDPTLKPPASWQRDVIGNSFVDEVRTVCIRNTWFDDTKWLSHLKSLPALESLILDDIPITDDGLGRIGEPPNLRVLSLRGTLVTDIGLKYLQSLTNLEGLSLGDTQVTDAGLEHLKGLTNLERLSLSGTQVSHEGVEKLQEALPNCRIEHWRPYSHDDRTP